RKKVFVATGTGIAPFRSMIIDCLSRYELLTMNYELILYWGLRLEEDIYWKEEFENLEKQYPNFHFYLVLSKASDHWQGKTGHVTEHVLNEEKDLENSDFYLCGNKEMVKELEEQLLAKNVPKERIKTELFY
ncbi:hypothetical protein KJ618_04050, partial [Patescibacteria group bacterium]|nr:hypothetical protein [Patescibacteria group bacterium]